MKPFLSLKYNSSKNQIAYLKSLNYQTITSRIVLKFLKFHQFTVSLLSTLAIHLNQLIRHTLSHLFFLQKFEYTKISTNRAWVHINNPNVQEA